MAAVRGVRPVRAGDLARLYGDAVPLDVLIASLADAPDDSLVEAIDAKLAAMGAWLPVVRDLLRTGEPSLGGLELLRRALHRAEAVHPIRILGAADIIEAFSANDIRLDGEDYRLHANLTKLKLQQGAHLLLIDYEDPAAVWTFCRVRQRRRDPDELVLTVLARQARQGPRRHIAPPSMAIVVAPTRVAPLIKWVSPRTLIDVAIGVLKDPVTKLKNARRRYRQFRES